MDGGPCLNCNTPDGGDASYPGDSGFGSEVGPVGNSARSQLCPGSCDPKRLDTTPDNPLACWSKDAGLTSTDGGVYGADLACRVVQQSSSDPVALQCTAAGSHGDGASCTSGADCAAGYECTGTPGVCHHYCCTDDFCSTRLGPTYFCDVQPETVSPSTLVPVCLLAEPCDLLQGTCGDGMTCTLVDPSSSDVTSCVQTGPAKEGDSCEVDHCEANLVCFGQVGSRVCKQLCDGNHGCTYGEQCSMQWPTLQKLNVGICLP